MDVFLIYFSQRITFYMPVLQNLRYSNLSKFAAAWNDRQLIEIIVCLEYQRNFSKDVTSIIYCA